MATAKAKSKTAGSKATRKRTTSATKRTRGRLAPGANARGLDAAQVAIAMEVGRFSERTLAASLREREGYASRLLEIDTRTKKIIESLQARGFKSPYLRNCVVARINKPDSPHLALRHTDARLYFGCAETDQYAPQEIIDKLRAEAESCRADAEVEIYPGTAHGFAFPQRPAYNKPAAERHWERLFALFGGALKGAA